jgi:hypothetical protein
MALARGLTDMDSVSYMNQEEAKAESDAELLSSFVPLEGRWNPAEEADIMPDHWVLSVIYGEDYYDNIVFASSDDLCQKDIDYLAENTDAVSKHPAFISVFSMRATFAMDVKDFDIPWRELKETEQTFMNGWTFLVGLDHLPILRSAYEGTYGYYMWKNNA